MHAEAYLCNKAGGGRNRATGAQTGSIEQERATAGQTNQIRQMRQQCIYVANNGCSANINSLIEPARAIDRKKTARHQQLKDGKYPSASLNSFRH
ncbi:hypothetical protein JFK97_16425 [Chromobacterium phragmitis]|uniref:hypothetical protein n=1 Tax=Chromobacterium amazonense TaxID=1382803 RepID=UPI0021B8092C|nr:hypothetical protein [Chromobacterium amazonense]MBM2885984.1 hypothetical protein [Chromobacterium amazonense]MDE1715891.1 hypothetical protein [Chromobacterium amazonense]